MFKTLVLLLLLGGGIAYALGWLFWKIIGRPIAYSAGWLAPTAYDFEVVGWKAERAGDTRAAVAAYQSAIALDPNSETAKERLEILTQRIQDEEQIADQPD